MKLSREYVFTVAHFLPFMPKDQENGRMHGHTYRCRVHLDGPVDSEKLWIADGVFLDWAWSGIHHLIDHRLANDRIPIPTSEALAAWICCEIVKDEHVGRLVEGVSLKRELSNSIERVYVTRHEAFKIRNFAHFAHFAE